MHDQYHALVLAEGFIGLETTERWARNRIADAVRDLRTSGALGDDEDSLDAAKALLNTFEDMRDRRS